MKGSRCRRGHGTWWPARERCPACAEPVEEATLPDHGRVLAATGEPRVAVVALGEAVVPALAEGALAVGAEAQIEADADGRLRARPR